MPRAVGRHSVRKGTKSRRPGKTADEKLPVSRAGRRMPPPVPPGGDVRPPFPFPRRKGSVSRKAKSGIGAPELYVGKTEQYVGFSMYFVETPVCFIGNLMCFIENSKYYVENPRVRCGKAGAVCRRGGVGEKNVQDASARAATVCPVVGRPSAGEENSHRPPKVSNPLSMSSS